MSDITGSPALDLAIGLGFVYFILSLLVSTAQEAIATVLKWRSKQLKEGLESMLQGNPLENFEDLSDEFLQHPLIRTMYRDRGKGMVIRRKRSPSYVAPRAFSSAMVDVLSPTQVRDQLESAAEDDRNLADKLTGKDGAKLDLLEVVKHRANGVAALAPGDEPTSLLPEHVLPLPPDIKRILNVLIEEASGEIDEFRIGLERWFDDAMARVSGWYKRKSTIALYVIAAVVTIALNANSLTIAQTFIHDPTVLATAVGQAQTLTESDDAEAPAPAGDFSEVDQLLAVGIPLGWASDDQVSVGEGTATIADPRKVDLSSFGGIIHALGGWLLTIFAIGLGAPFWFDSLSRLARLRGTGKPETPLPASGHGQANERIR